MNIWFIIGGIYSLLAVIAGTFAAHILQDVLSPYAKSIFRTAVLYHMFHSLALFITGILQLIFYSKYQDGHFQSAF